jgi:hypothetical protein
MARVVVATGATPQFVDTREWCGCTTTPVYATVDPNNRTTEPVFITYSTKPFMFERPHDHRQPIIRVSQRRERPRECRSSTRTASASRGDPSPEPEPPLTQLRGFLAASVRMVQHCERRRAKCATT